MTRLILDTTVLVDAERTARDLNRLIADDDDVAIAAVTATELLVAVELTEGARRSKRASFVRSILDIVPVEGYDLPVTTEQARLLAHVRRTGNQVARLIRSFAATAVARDRLMVSSDSTAFGGVPGVHVRN